MPSSAAASPGPTPVAISATASSLSSSSLPEPLRALIQARVAADSALQSPQLEAELAEGTAGPSITALKEQLLEIVAQAGSWKAQVGRKISPDEDARGQFVLAWALGRVGEYDGTTPEELPAKLEDALAVYADAGRLLQLPAPPALDQVPSVTRPNENRTRTTAPLVVLDEQPAWVAEFLAEWARTQTTLAFSMLLRHEQVIEEARLADLLDLACRRNVQALFTPVDPLTASDDTNPSEAATVLGNSRLIRDMSTMFPFTSSPALWARRIDWATHVADVRFVEASMSANRLVDAASASASILQSASTSDKRRHEVRGMLEATIRRLVPFEKAQGSCLLGLGRTMLSAVGSLYLNRSEVADDRRRRDQSRDSTAESDDGPIVPENDLVRETRQVLIRSAGLFENAYASFRRTPAGPTTSREEQRILLKLEAAYCDLEELDNDTPEVVELRAQRVDRAMWINERLQALHDDLGNDSDSGDEEVDSDEDDVDLAGQMARHGI